MSPDVIAASSAEGEPVEPADGSEPVSSVVDSTPADAGDRPLINLKAEFDRKLTKVERQLSEMMQVLLANSQKPVPTPTAPREYTDQELWDMGIGGSKDAMDVYIQRQVGKQSTADKAATAQAQLVQVQLTTLYAKYPMLRTDPSHPLTALAIQAKQALVGAGYPNNHATDLEAIKTAIADSPELAVPKPAVRDAGRPSAVSAQQDVTGATIRRAVPAATTTPLTSREAAIAKRMGVKDPAKAKERFMKRNEEGRATVSPTVAGFVREEG